MVTCSFSELIWSRSGLTIQGDIAKRFALHHLKIEVANDSESHDARRMYHIKLSRTERVLCRVYVSPDEHKSFREFQDAVMMSKLSQE